MTTSGFYLSDLTYAPNWVIAPGYQLLRSAKDSYTYPVEGWYWFDSLEQACAFFDVPVPEDFNQGTGFVPSNGGADWDGFNAAILSDTAFNQKTGAVMGVAPAVAIALPAALAQVSTNGVAAFGLVFNAFCTAGQVSSGQRATWATLAEGFNLPIEFVDVVRGE
jgi:hypothetical protein